MALLSASQLTLSYGELDVFSGVDIEVTDRARIGVVGPNGSGKTSLLKILIGDLEPNRGTVSQAKGLRLGYVPQAHVALGEWSLRDEVMKAFQRLRSLEETLATTAVDMDARDEKKRRHAELRYSSHLQEYEDLGGYDFQSRMERVVAAVGLTSNSLDSPVNSASGGERSRAMLAKALLADPDLLILDEPTNYLDFEALAWLEGFLARFQGAFIVVSHDRYFLDKVVSQVWELERGQLQKYRGNYTMYRAQRTHRVERQQKEFERQQKHIEKEEEFIRRYHAGQRAREARGRLKKLRRLERIEAPRIDETVHISRVSARRTGQVVIQASELGVGFHDGQTARQLLWLPELKLERNDRVAVIGPNGAGKTTLFQTLLGLMQPLAGTVTTGQNIKIGYLRQGDTDLPEHLTVLEALLEARNLRPADARNYLARFLFQGEDVHQPLATCSGGERTRLALARLLVTEPDVLILDEPTTHLDIPSREALEEVLISYNGTLLFASHDRHLISLLADQLWVLEQGEISFFKGSFEAWTKKRQEALAPAPKSRKPRVKRNVSRSKGRNLQPEIRDVELSISKLETRLVEIEGELLIASEDRAIEKIAGLGEQYNQAQAQLDQIWERWARLTSDQDGG
ncbi:MAG: ABC-F family ATP-binding cassette domain-containing protein [Chloroflexi bacterium]|nr:ABC-F family ATP-binding cassette domain-containing protein [Chloroflexota bacterium]